MFLGISHFILSAPYNGTANIIKLLINNGYEVDFTENQIKNNNNKNSFMFHNNQYHNIIFLKHKKRYSIEIVAYEELESINSNLLVSFEKKLTDEDQEVCTVLGKIIYFNEVLHVEYFIDAENTFIFKTNNVEQEIQFWNCLGFTNIETNVNIKSPIKPWRGNIEFFTDSNCLYTYMDNIGVNTICMLTNNIAKEKSKLDVISSDIFKMNVNKKELQNLLIKRDSYNIELLEMK